MTRPTREQREADALVRAYWRRKLGPDTVKGDEISCERARAQILLFVQWLRGQAEALRSPVTRYRTLLAPLPVLDDRYRGVLIEDVLEDVADIGQCVRRAQRRRGRARTAPAGVWKMNDRAVHAIIAAHAARTDEPLVLAVRYRLDEFEDVHLLEVLGGFPGGDDDELLQTVFEPSPRLKILGNIHLTLGSPTQVLAAIARKDPIIAELKRGRVVHDDKSKDAFAIKRALGLERV